MKIIYLKFFLLHQSNKALKNLTFLFPTLFTEVIDVPILQAAHRCL